MIGERVAALALRAWSEIAGALDDVLFPMACPICSAPARGHALCPGCQLELIDASGRVCPRCALQVGPYEVDSNGCAQCRGRSLGFDGAVALGPYAGPVRHLVLTLKHSSNAWLAHWMGDLLVRARSEELADWGRHGSPVLVPVPLHWARRLTRGYNQAEALAQAIGRATHWPVRPALRRTRATPKLAGLSKTERAARVAGAFRAKSGNALLGKTVVLVDDVYTTGATSGSAARVLKKAGAARVYLAVLARADLRKGRS